jgi:hypothetical protein
LHERLRVIRIMHVDGAECLHIEIHDMTASKECWLYTYELRRQLNEYKTFMLCLLLYMSEEIVEGVVSAPTDNYIYVLGIHLFYLYDYTSLLLQQSTLSYFPIVSTNKICQQYHPWPGQTNSELRDCRFLGSEGIPYCTELCYCIGCFKST